MVLKSLALGTVLSCFLALSARADDGYTYREVYYAREIAVFLTPQRRENDLHVPVDVEVRWQDPSNLAEGVPVPWRPRSECQVLDSFAITQSDTTVDYDNGDRTYHIELKYSDFPTQQCVRVTIMPFTPDSIEADSTAVIADMLFRRYGPSVGDMTYAVHVISYYDPAHNAVPLPPPGEATAWIDLNDGAEERDGELIMPRMLVAIQQSTPSRPEPTVREPRVIQPQAEPSEPALGTGGIGGFFKGMFAAMGQGEASAWGIFIALVGCLGLVIALLHFLTRPRYTYHFAQPSAQTGYGSTPSRSYGGGGGGSGGSGGGGSPSHASSGSSGGGYEGPSEAVASSGRGSGGRPSGMDRVTGTTRHDVPEFGGHDVVASSRVDSDGRQFSNDGLIPGVGGDYEGRWTSDGKGGADLRESEMFGDGGSKLHVDSDGTVTRPGMFGSLDAEHVGKMDSDGNVRDMFGNIVEKFDKD